MLNYEEFAEAFKEKISEKIGAMPEKGVLEFMKKEKINCEVDGITFRTIGSTVAPCIYIQNYYEMYQRGESLDEIVGEAAELLYEQRNANIDTPSIRPGKFKGKIIFQIINTEQNARMLSHMPHREMEDLSVIYRALVGQEGDRFSSIMITDEVAESLKLTEEQLYEEAYKNTREIMKPTVSKLEHVLGLIMKARGVSEDQANYMDDMFREDTGVYVISNSTGMMGAATMLYDDVLQDVAEKLKGDLMILPSSLHEVLALSAKGASVEFLSETVHTVNETVVDVQDKLSDNVYFYDKDARTLKIVTSDRDLEHGEPEHKHSGR